MQVALLGCQELRPYNLAITPITHVDTPIVRLTDSQIQLVDEVISKVPHAIQHGVCVGKQITQMTIHYVATVSVKFTDNDGQDRSRFQRVGAMFRNTRGGDGSEFFSLKLDFPVAVSELVMFLPSAKDPQD